MSDYDKFKKFFDEMGIEYEEKEYHSEKSLLVDENFVNIDYIYVTFDNKDKFKYFEVY